MGEPVEQEVDQLTPGEVVFTILDGSPGVGVSIPLEAIMTLTLVAWYDQEVPDSDTNIINTRANIPLIQDGAVLGGLPDGLTFAYAQDDAGVWKAALGYRAADQPIVDEQLPYERHRLLLSVVTTASPDAVPIEIVFKVRNLRRVGAV